MAILSLQDAITALQNCVAVQVGDHISFISPEEDFAREVFLEINIGEPDHPERTYECRRAANQLVKTDGHSMWLHAEDEDERLELKLLGYTTICNPDDTMRVGRAVGKSWAGPLDSSRIAVNLHAGALLTLINLHEGIADGGPGITEADWATLKSLVKYTPDKREA
jgi:hypothetical protein